MAYPAVSIVIPVYNDPTGIQSTLESLLTQSIDDYRIVVVDNDSTDRTPDAIRSYDDDHLTLIHETDVQSSYAARNAGIRASSGEILAFVDADVTVSEDWLDSALWAFETTDADYVGCDIELTPPKDPTLAARYDRHTGFPVERYLEHQNFAPTCCLFVRREVFEDVGLFDPRLVSGGDKEFGNRVAAADYRMGFATDVSMSHPTRNSIRSLAGKERRVGRGHAQLQRYYPERYGTPGVPPRPSGAKSPRNRNADLSPTERIAFSALSTVLTGVRATGYLSELVDPVDNGAQQDVDGPPRVDG